ncbi:hypothetical protein GIB67_011344 [Kingdonia uniflora]|uniref:Uncharacterized protein n=1 Tax=Kingdonia uniflora TaxID=39325 RepID=A0A7J7MD96_9MAGN|nr:hypothetical protein GIB67_011344 [Kingdonia uniflora]
MFRASPPHYPIPTTITSTCLRLKKYSPYIHPRYHIKYLNITWIVSKITIHTPWISYQIFKHNLDSIKN